MFEELMRMMQLMKDRMPTPRLDEQRSQPKLGYNPKLESPTFDGINPMVWIKKCCKYFNLCKIPDDQKVDLASLNMTGKAKNLISSYLAKRSNVDWSDFMIDVSARFMDERG
uniref:Uncharacterized protein n=1 Tax=Chenopodium quinoa TaxID=63459 RepID=A0A803M6Z9_CHEQI